jgi:hypothetical protein
MKTKAILASLGGVLLVVGCGERPDGSGRVEPPEATGGIPQFRDVTEASGVAFRNVCGCLEKDWVLEVNGSGVVLFDYDGDGKLDIFLVNGSKLDPPHGKGPGDPPPSDALFRNLGGMRFQDVTAEAGLTESAWGCGAAAGDYDNDGDRDLYVANYGRDCLWRNNGDGTFTDVTEQSGADDPYWGSSCTFVDVDRDGFLDIFVVNYLEFDPEKVKRRGQDPNCQYKGQLILCGPIGLPPAPCTLYRNRGDGTFEDVSESSGIRSVNLAEATYGLGVVPFDADGDGWPDLYVANDTCPNLLFRNRGDGTFEEVGALAGVAFSDEGQAQAGMGVDAVFLGEREDLFVVNYEDDRNTFYQNDGTGGGQVFFTETTSAIGLAEPCFKNLGWGTFFFDADFDGDQDLFIAQGHVIKQADQVAGSPGWLQANKLFVNDGEGKFRDATAEAGPGLGVVKSSRGAACGDLDGDGDLDIVISDIDEGATVLENVTKGAGHWLAVRVVGSKANRDGLGAVVELEADGRVQRRRIRSAASYASQSESLARFGLGEVDEVTALQVVWPGGGVEAFEVDGVDRVVVVEQGKGGTGAR